MLAPDKGADWSINYQEPRTWRFDFGASFCEFDFTELNNLMLLYFVAFRFYSFPCVEVCARQYSRIFLLFISVLFIVCIPSMVFFTCSIEHFDVR